MPKSLAAAAALLCVSLSAQAEPILHQHPWDYLSHAAGGAAISLGADQFGLHPAVGIAAAAFVGYGKEAWHDKHFDNRDAVAWVVGAGLSALAIDIFKDDTRRVVISPSQLWFFQKF